MPGHPDEPPQGLLLIGAPVAALHISPGSLSNEEAVAAVRKALFSVTAVFHVAACAESHAAKSLNHAGMKYDGKV